MTDYYPVILRAVAALETNTFEDRRAIYNRARAVQAQQLGKRPFNKTDFDRERSMLEDAISRVEIEATTKRIAAEASPSAPAGPSDIVPTPMTPLPPARSWLKRVLYRLWRPEVYNQARCEGFMWLRTVDIGAHQACCPLLQALFMTAKAPTMSTVTVRMINTEVFIATSPLRAPTPTDPDSSWFKMNPP